MLQRWSTGPLVAVGLFIPLVFGRPRISESSKSVDVDTTDEEQRSIGVSNGNVCRSEDHAIVTPLDGDVHISNEVRQLDAEVLAEQPHGFMIPSGNSVELLADSISYSRRNGLGDITTRQARRLVFRKSTLAEMGAEFNRYNRHLQIHVKDEVGRPAVYSAVFDADSPESLLDYLATDSRFALRRTGVNVIVDIRPNREDARPSVAEAVSRN